MADRHSGAAENCKHKAHHARPHHLHLAEDGQGQDNDESGHSLSVHNSQMLDPMVVGSVLLGKDRIFKVSAKKLVVCLPP